jgi:ribosome assembly protein RRB1
MSKRPADSEQEQDAIKNGDRPMEIDQQDEAGEFEDEFEDEFESEDEILEAGVDGRPDEERKAEERESMSTSGLFGFHILIPSRWHGR